MQSWLWFAGVRAALFPLAVRQIQASAGVAQVLRQVWLSNKLALTQTLLMACFACWHIDLCC